MQNGHLSRQHSTAAPVIIGDLSEHLSAPVQRDLIHMFKTEIHWTTLFLQNLLWSTPASGIPWAFCTRAWSTSLAETKKMRSLAWARSTTPSSSTRKLVHRSICCLRTWHVNNAFIKHDMQKLIQLEKKEHFLDSAVKVLSDCPEMLIFVSVWLSFHRSERTLKRHTKWILQTQKPVMCPKITREQKSAWNWD